MVGLDGTGGQHDVRSLPARIVQQELELTHLVPKAQKRLPCRDLSERSAISAVRFSGALSSGRAAAQGGPDKEESDVRSPDTRSSRNRSRPRRRDRHCGLTRCARGHDQGRGPGAPDRSEALNNLYGNAVTRLSPDAFNALVVRSEGLNSYGKTLQASTPVTSTSASTSFAWDDFGIGMAAAFGLVLLTCGLAVAVRTGTRKRVRIPS